MWDLFAIRSKKFWVWEKYERFYHMEIGTYHALTPWPHSFQNTGNTNVAPTKRRENQTFPH